MLREMHELREKNRCPHVSRWEKKTLKNDLIQSNRYPAIVSRKSEPLALQSADDFRPMGVLSKKNMLTNNQAAGTLSFSFHHVFIIGTRTQKMTTRIMPQTTEGRAFRPHTEASPRGSINRTPAHAASASFERGATVSVAR